MTGFPPRLRRIDEQAIVDAYESGMLVKALLNLHQVDTITMYRILDQHGVPRRKRMSRRYAQEVRDRVRDAYLAGKSRAVIAAECGVSNGFIDLVVRDTHAAHRQVKFDRDAAVGLMARWVCGGPLTAAELESVVALVGDGRRHIGLGGLRSVPAEFVGEVAELVIAETRRIAAEREEAPATR